MSVTETLEGRKYKWKLLNKLGEGDAGEVFLAKSSETDLIAVVKRPGDSVPMTTAVRQASQIETEGKILDSLAQLSFSKNGFYVKTINFIDQSKVGTEESSKFFIVIEKASGYDLRSLARVSKFGIENQGDHTNLTGDQNQVILQTITDLKKIPDLILLRTLSGTLSLFEKIHHHRAKIEGEEKYGIIWNDVKADHIFWNWEKKQFSIIDWGNGRFLEKDGATKDRKFTRGTDYRQFLREMDTFLAEASPSLHNSLHWPSEISDKNYPQQIQGLNIRIEEHLQNATAGLVQVRDRERALLRIEDPTLKTLEDVQNVQKQVASQGEKPEIQESLALYEKIIKNILQDGESSQIKQVARLAAQIPGASSKWEFIYKITDIAEKDNSLSKSGRNTAISTCLREDWTELLWILRRVARDDPEPKWWTPLSAQVRGMVSGIDVGQLTLLAALLRYRERINNYEAELFNLIQESKNRGDSSKENEPRAKLSASNLFIQNLNNVCRNWKSLEPSTNQNLIDYRVNKFIAEAPIKKDHDLTIIFNHLKQINTLVDIVISNWESKDLQSARQGLRRLLLWDPNRRRLLTADQLLNNAQNSWGKSLSEGPKDPNDPRQLSAFAQQMLPVGRQFENQIGKAPWLTDVLTALNELEKGRIEPNTQQRPKVRAAMPWIRNIERKKVRRGFFGTSDRDHQIEPDAGMATLTVTLLSSSQQNSLRQFHTLLRNGATRSAKTELEKLPGEISKPYSNLIEGFQKVLKTPWQDFSIPQKTEFGDDPDAVETIEALTIIRSWRIKLQKQGIEEAGKFLDDNSYPYNIWKFFYASYGENQAWLLRIFPYIVAIIQKDWSFSSPTSHPLQRVFEHLQAAANLWEKAVKRGLPFDLLSEISQNGRGAQKSLVGWLDDLQSSEKRYDKILFEAYEWILLKEYIGNLIDNLTEALKYRKHFVPDYRLYEYSDKKNAKGFLNITKALANWFTPSETQAENWINSYKAIEQAGSRKILRERIIQLDKTHPLGDWLSGWPKPVEWRTLILIGALISTVLCFSYSFFRLYSIFQPQNFPLHTLTQVNPASESTQFPGVVKPLMGGQCYEGPSNSSSILAEFKRGEEIQISGVSNNRSWLYINIPKSSKYCWIERGKIDSSGEINNLQIIPSIELITNTPTPSLPPSLTPTPTFTPEPSPTPTITLTPSYTPPLPTPEPLKIQGVINAPNGVNCRQDPNGSEIIKALKHDVVVAILGRNEDGSWLWIATPELEKNCWVDKDLINVFGEISNLEIITPTPIPSPTIVVPETNTNTSDARADLPQESAAICQQTIKWTLEGNWNEYYRYLESLTPRAYEETRSNCGWTFVNLRQKKLDIRLKNILKYYQSGNDSEAKAQLFALDNISIPHDPPNTKEDQIRFIRWLRTTIALCNILDEPSLTKSKLGYLEEYFDWHTKQYDTGENNFQKICRRTSPSHFQSSPNNVSQIELNTIIDALDLTTQAGEACIEKGDTGNLFMTHETGWNGGYCSFNTDALTPLEHPNERRMIDSIHSEFCNLRFLPDRDIDIFLGLRMDQPPSVVEGGLIPIQDQNQKSYISQGIPSSEYSGFLEDSQLQIPQFEDWKCDNPITVEAYLIGNLVFYAVNGEMIKVLPGIFEDEFRFEPIDIGLATTVEKGPLDYFNIEIPVLNLGFVSWREGVGR